MTKFLWEQRNPWNFNLYTPEEVTNIKKVQECLGHTNIKTTQIYTHDMQEDEFDNVIEGITKIEKGESEK